MPAPVAALSLFISMLVILCVPPLLLISMLARRQALVAVHQKPAFQAALVSAGAVLVFNLVVCIVARPDISNAAALWNSLGAVHAAAALMSWLSFWGCVALSTLVRHRHRTKQPDASDTDGGTMA